MSASTTASIPGSNAQAELFNLTERGVVAAIEKRLGLTDRAPMLVSAIKRVFLVLLVTWVAPLVIDVVAPARHDGHAVGFLADVETEVRALVTIPLLLVAERPIGLEIARVLIMLRTARHCLDRARFDAHIRWAKKLLDKPIADVALVALAYLIVGVWIRPHGHMRDTWLFATSPDGTPELSLAGRWQAYASLPLYLYLLLRWAWRWVVLGLAFFRLSPGLRFIAPHADRAGGIAFVSRISRRFSWLVLGLTAVASAKWSTTLAREHVSRVGVASEISSAVILAVVLAFAPLLGFAYRFTIAKRRALHFYGGVVTDHGREIEGQWKRSVYPHRVKGAESSSLGDLLGVYDAVRRVHFIPYRRVDALVVIAAAMVPLLPLLGWLIPVDAALVSLLAALL